MIESHKDCEQFLNESSKHDVIIFVIPSEDSSFHVSSSEISAILVKDIETNKTYEFSFDHPDCKYKVNLKDFEYYIQRKNNLWCFDAKSASQLISIPNLLDVELYTHLKENYILDINSLETSAHRFIKRNYNKQKNINNIIPLLKHKEMFENMCSEITSKVNLSKELDRGYIKENYTILHTLSILEKTGIHINPVCFKNHFPNATIYNNDIVYSQYNIYTSTGRPSNRFDGVNYAALNKSDGVRKCFTSRWGEEGKMVLIDYSAFHPRIISYLTKFPLGIDIDIYSYLGELYFNRKVTEYDMDEIKSITMRQFYGGVEEKYQHIKYLNHAKEFIEKYWKLWKDNGFINTPLFRRIITNKHLLDVNPYKLLNYILQATETEVAISALKIVIDYLTLKKTKAVLYTYDSILFDFYKPDGQEVIDSIVNIMKMGNRFPVKIYEGDSYDSVAQINM